MVNNELIVYSTLVVVPTSDTVGRLMVSKSESHYGYDVFFVQPDAPPYGLETAFRPTYCISKPYNLNLMAFVYLSKEVQ